MTGYQMTADLGDSGALLQRMVDAVELARQRLVNAANAMKIAGIEYAVVGDNAVVAWVATVDRAAVRNTQDVDILIRRADFASARSALQAAGFVYRRAAGMDMFLDDATAGPREAVRLVFAGEIVKPGEPAANPDVAQATDMGLDALVRIKLTAFRDKDRTHLRDLIGVGLVDQSWTSRLPPMLAQRLQAILDTPEG